MKGWHAGEVAGCMFIAVGFTLLVIAGLAAGVMLHAVMS